MGETKKGKILFVYRIKIPWEVCTALFIFENPATPYARSQSLQLFESLNGNMYLVTHGDTHGYTGAFDNTYTVTELSRMYKSVLFMKNKKVLNLICCNTYFTPTYCDPSGFEVRPAFRVPKEIYCRATPCKGQITENSYGYYEITCEEKLQISRGLSSDIRFWREITQEEFEGKAKPQDEPPADD